MKPLRLSVAESGRCGFLPASKVACRRKFTTAGAGDCGRSAFSLRYAAPGEYGRSYGYPMVIPKIPSNLLKYQSWD
jgi:hypothetical protein